MPDQPRPPVLRYLRAVLGPDADGPTDADLLGRFVADRDQAAFELLVFRHAGMLMRVARAVLRDHHAAEDVTQAAFLVLARKAGSVGRREAIAGWLYRVAHRLAVRAAARRRPTASANLDSLAVPDEPTPDDISSLLHAELARLPDRYRVPLLLCFFEGLSHADAAKRLGWPVGTVAGRIARAKDELQRRLTRKGALIPAAGIVPYLAVEAAPAASPTFADATARAAVHFAAGTAVVPGVSPTVLVLATGALRTMTATKFQWAAGILAVCGALSLGGLGALAAVNGSTPGGNGEETVAMADQPAASKERPPVTPLEKLTSQENGRIVTIELLVREVRRGKSQTRKADDGQPDDLILAGVQSLKNDDRVHIVLTGAARPDWSKWNGAPEYGGVRYLRRMVRATGKLSAMLYTGFPAFMVYEVLVDDPKQIEILEQPQPDPAESQPAKEPPAGPASASQRLKSLNNLKQIMLAIHNYEAAYTHLPEDIRDKNGKVLLSWRVAILPFIEQDHLYRQFKLDEPWDSEHNKKLMARMPDLYRVGIEPKDATDTYYRVFVGPGTPFAPPPPVGAGAGPPGGNRLARIADGTSNTVGVVEAGPPVPWTKPQDISFDPKKPLPKLAGPFTNVLHVSFLDASTFALKRDLKEETLKAYIGAEDGIVTPSAETFKAHLPPQTPEDRELLKKMIAANQNTIAVIEGMLKEHAALLKERNKNTTDVLQAEEDARELQRMADQLRRMIQRLKDEEDSKPTGKSPPPVPPKKD